MSRRRGMAPAVKFKVWQRDGFRCAYCGKNASSEALVLEVDHIIAVARGGSSELENLTTACRPCNLRKGIKDWPGAPRPKREPVRKRLVPTVLLAPEPTKCVLRNRVRERRIEVGFGQSELAIKANVSRQTLVVLERNGGYEPTMAVVHRLIATLQDMGLFWWEEIP